MKKNTNRVVKRTIRVLTVTVLLIGIAASAWAFGKAEDSNGAISAVFKDVGLDVSDTREFVNTEVLQMSGESGPIHDGSESLRLVFFGATWCPACQKELPHLESLNRTFKKTDLALKFVFIEEDPSHVTGFMQENGYTLPYAIDTTGRAASLNYIEAYPTAYLLDSNGNTVFRIRGVLEWTHPQLIAALQKAITIWKG